MEKIQFKSLPEHWNKEYSGLKPNTVRKVDIDVRFQLLDRFVKKPFQLIIEIVNTETLEKFQREVKDVSTFTDLYIISW